MSESKKRILGWEDICEFASGKFDVWANNAGQLWAEKAWNKLVKNGLAAYENEIQRHIVIIRILTLAVLYNEFCDLVWNEYFDNSMVSSSDWLNNDEFFHPIRVWQLVGKDFYGDEKIHDIDTDDLLNEAILELIDKQRNIVYEASNKGFGNDLELFFSLLLTRYSREDGSEYNIDELSEKERKDLKLDRDYLDENEERGFYWVSIGMPRSARENV
ncbi:MAG: hypothetical protein ACYCX4_17710 [Bacillota bacterium]